MVVPFGVTSTPCGSTSGTQASSRSGRRTIPSASVWTRGDYKPLKVSRPITRVGLAPDPPGRQLGHGLRTLAVGFSILELDDGLAGQVIYEGKRDARLA